jgi:hypothetical protein
MADGGAHFMDRKPKQAHHLDEGLFEPVRGLLHLFAPLDFGSPFTIKNEYRTGVQSDEMAEAVEEGTHLRILASVVVVVAKNGTALDEPYAAPGV